MSDIITRTAGSLRTIGEIKADLETHKLRAAQNIIEIGKDLRDAKAQLGHGDWLPFLQEAGFSPRTAQNYMRLAEAVQTDSQLAQLPYTKALALLDAPEEVRSQEGIEDKSAAEIRRLTQAVNDEAAARLRAEHEAANEKRLREATAKEMIAETKEKNQLRAQLNELREHPQTVEVAPPDYDTLKERLREAEQAAAEAEERAAAMLSPAPAEEQEDVLSIRDALEAANAFSIKCWMLPYMGPAFAAMDERQRGSYRVVLRSVISLCQKALETIDSADVIEGAII